MTHRIDKVNTLIHKEFATLLGRQVDFKPGVLVTITKVETTKDLRHARVFVSVLPAHEATYAMETIRRELYTLQGQLNKKLHMHPLPRIDILYDDTEERADAVEKLLKTL